MREMKDSGVPWIGEIPKEWGLHRIRNHFKIISGSGFREDVQGQTEGEIPICKASDISASGKLMTKAANYLTEREANNEGFTIIDSGSILLPKIGEAMKKNTRTIAYVRCCVDNNCQGLTPILYDQLFSYYLLTLIDMNWFNNGGTIPCVNNQKLKDCPIPYPSLLEQNRIADFLDTKCAEIDSVLEKTKASIEEYKKLKQSVITEAVTKGVRGKRPMKDSGVEWIGEIPTEWELNKLKFIVQRITKGNGITKEEVFEDGDMPCVRYGEIYTKYNISFSKCVSATRLDIQTSPQYVQSGDILVVGTGELVEEIGKSIAYMGCDSCLAGGDIIVIKHDLNPLFLSYALNSNYAQTQRSCGKAKLKVVHISASEIGNLLIALPSPVEQQEIAAYLDEKCAAIDALISSKEALVAELETYKKSIIYEYVTGKKEAIELT